MEQEHHGKLMFIVLGLIAIIVVVLGLVVVVGRKDKASPIQETPVVQSSKTFDEATAAQEESLFTEAEIREFEQATSASGSGGLSASEVEALKRATSAN